MYKWTTSVDAPNSGEVLHHMCDSGEFPDVSVCHTLLAQQVCLYASHMICLPVNEIVIPSRSLSIWKSVHPSSIPASQPSAKFTVRMPRSIAGLNFPNVQIPG